MGILQSIENWNATHHPRWLVLPRVALGICILIKGISFVRNTVALKSLIVNSKFGIPADALTLIITSLHLLCGFFIIIGLFTRWATLIMIPILAYAVLFINARKGIFVAESEFTFSLIILLFLIFFFVAGGGYLSLDRYIKQNPK